MELIAGHVLFRHGERTPLSSYPTDPMKVYDWPDGYGQLTSIGIDQAYRFGQYLRTRYGSLLNEKYERHEIYVRSTDYDRTLMTAQSCLIGLYPKTRDSTTKIPIQPVPIHTVPKGHDNLFGSHACPKYRQIKRNKFQIDELKKLNKYYESFFKDLEKWTKAKKLSVYHTANIPDTILIEAIHRKAPAWVTDDVLRNLTGIKGVLMYLGFSNDDVKRMRGAPVIKDMWENMDRSVNGRSYLKMKLYAAHDTTIAAVLSFLGINYPHQPPVAGALFVDLYEQDTNYFVKVEYLNVTDSKKAYPITLKDCPGVECPFKKFTSIYQPRFPGSVEDECTIKSPSSETSNRHMLIAILCLIITVVVLLSVIATLVINGKSRRKEYEQPLTSNGTS